MPVPSHLATWLRSLFLLLENFGYSRVELFDILGRDATVFDKPLERVPVEDSNRLWGLAYKHCGDQLGLRIAEFNRVSDFQSIGAAIASAHTVQEAALLLERYLCLLADIVRLECTMDGDGLHLRFWYEESVPWQQERLEGVILLTLNSLSQLLNSPIEFSNAQLIRKRPRDPAPWRDVFACPIQWGCDQAVVSLSPAQAARRLLTSNPEMQSSFENHLNRLLHEREGQDPLSAIRSEIQRRLGEPDLSLDQVAKQLALSPRSLQRRLREQNTSFRDLYKQLRMERAVAYFREGKTANEVAYLLGYAEPTVFHRAFKQWTGETPSHFYPEH